MARRSDTRALVRKFAQQVHDQGGTPTPALMRRMLGNKGSPNTILDELRKWMSELKPQAQPAAPAGTPLPSAQELADTAALLKRLSAQADEQQALLRQSHSLDRSLEAISSQFAQLASKLAEDRKWMQEALELMNSRFEAVQRRALLQIDEARSEATKWRERHQHLQSEFGTWKEANRQRTQRLLDEVAWLKGKLGLPLPEGTSAQAAGPAAGEPSYHAPPQRRAVYPGHPRAIGGSPDD